LSAHAHASGSVVTNERGKQREVLQLRAEVANEKKRADDAERQGVVAQNARTNAEKKRKQTEDAAVRKAKKAKKAKPANTKATTKAETKDETKAMKALEKQFQDLRDTMTQSLKDTTCTTRDSTNLDDSKTTTDLKVDKATAQAKYEVLKEQATLQQANLMEVAYMLSGKQRIQPQSPHVATGLRKTGMTLEDLALLTKTERSNLYTATKVDVIETCHIEVSILKLN
jgi:hypothetical protein